MENIVIATIREWNINNAYKLKNLLKKDRINTIIVKEKLQLNYDYIKKINPIFIFFPHWSWMIPEKIFTNYECVVFHMTDLPFGRGGSPLQNLIIRKIYNTKISAIKVEKGIDTGPIYIKRDFNITFGSAEEIFIAASKIIFFDMIPYIIKNKPVPYPQKGEIVIFNRRKPEESNLKKANLNNLDDIYDFIRMLDADNYPHAFLEINNFKILFKEAHKKNDKIIGKFEIVYKND